jgi:hypothetical protein
VTICPVGAELLRADGRRDMTKLIAAFSTRICIFKMFKHIFIFVLETGYRLTSFRPDQRLRIDQTIYSRSSYMSSSTISAYYSRFSYVSSTFSIFLIYALFCTFADCTLFIIVKSFPILSLPIQPRKNWITTAQSPVFFSFLRTPNISNALANYRAPIAHTIFRYPSHSSTNFSWNSISFH